MPAAGRRTALGIPAPPRAGSASGTASEQTVVGDAIGIGRDSVGLQQLALPARAVIQIRAPGRDGEIGPSVGDAEVAQVDVRRPAPVVGQQGIRRTAIAVAYDQPVGRVSPPSRFSHTARTARSPATAATAGGTAVSRSRLALIRPACHLRRPCQPGPGASGARRVTGLRPGERRSLWRQAAAGPGQARSAWRPWRR